MENYNSLAAKVKVKCLYYEKKNRVQNSSVQQSYENEFSFFFKSTNFTTTVKNIIFISCLSLVYAFGESFMNRSSQTGKLYIVYLNSGAIKFVQSCSCTIYIFGPVSDQCPLSAL